VQGLEGVLRDPTSPRREASLLNLPGLRTRHFFCFSPTGTKPGRRRRHARKDASDGRRRRGRRRPCLTVNNVYAIQRAAEAGLGLAALPEFIVLGNSNLVRVLPEVEGPRIDAYFVYPEELRNSKRIQVFRDFLLRKVAEAEH